MRAERRGGQVELSLSQDELGRLVAALAEATTGVSRSEFYIKVGASLPVMEALVVGLESVAGGRSENFSIDIPEPVEEEENPRRPRTRANRG